MRSALDVCVVALGKIGLPLAVQIASKGHRVRGVDVNPELVALVNRGEEPFPGEADLAERLRTEIDAGRLTATTDGASAVAQGEVVVVVVPLIVDAASRPDFSAMDAATRTIAPALQPGTLVSYETTLPVHTTRTRFAPMLEEGSGLTVGEDLFLCHSPERVYSGRIFSDLRSYPKLVGGTDAASSDHAVAFYEAVLDFDERADLPRPNGVWDLGSAEAAELAKLVETTYRDVNIGLANEFAVFADRVGIDVHRVIEASNSQPFSHVHQPGIAVGGHCIPVYPRFYLSTHQDARLPAAAREVNLSMPAYAVERLQAVLGSLEGSRVAVLGAAYRGGVKELAFSGVYGVVDALRARGAEPLVHDPLFSDSELREHGFEPFALGSPADAVIVQANHDEYRALQPEDVPGVRALVDGRACVDPASWQTVPRLVIGSPGDVLAGDAGQG
jgi:nucleotide sugar dehydrogenase